MLATKSVCREERCGTETVGRRRAVPPNHVDKWGYMGSDKKGVQGYSKAQIGLHWAVVVLVAFQYVAHDGIERAWRGFTGGEAQPTEPLQTAYLHIAAGVLVFLLVLARIYLRFTRGAPPPPADEPKLLKIVAEAVHGSIYILLLLLPLSGSAAWFFAIEAAADAHEFFKTLLLAAIVLHVGGALFQHFLRRSDVLMRMFRAESAK
ncbi:MAG: cytochrome b [Rhizobiaceae bacterium]|nr:cytochrome b [Rhizobiaceae bacterium]